VTRGDLPLHELNAGDAIAPQLSASGLASHCAINDVSHWSGPARSCPSCHSARRCRNLMGTCEQKRVWGVLVLRRDGIVGVDGGRRMEAHGCSRPRWCRGDCWRVKAEHAEQYGQRLVGGNPARSLIGCAWRPHTGNAPGHAVACARQSPWVAEYAWLEYFQVSEDQVTSSAPLTAALSSEFTRFGGTTCPPASAPRIKVNNMPAHLQGHAGRPGGKHRQTSPLGKPRLRRQIASLLICTATWLNRTRTAAPAILTSGERLTEGSGGNMSGAQTRS